MAQRRCLYSLTRQAIALLSSNPNPLLHHSLKSSLPCLPETLSTQTFRSSPIFTNTAACHPLCSHHHHGLCYFSLNSGGGSEGENADNDEETAEEDSDGEEVKREYSAQEKEEEAASIGYKVIGPLGENERVIKPFEPVFAVVQIGSHQFKVSNGDCIFTERLKFCHINDKLILNKVLLLGSKAQTIVGRPTVPDAVVHALVEEHALDAKVIIFKKKRRKNYRRTKGHRQELTKLRITDIQGIEKPEMKVDTKPRRAPAKKLEKVPVGA